MALKKVATATAKAPTALLDAAKSRLGVAKQGTGGYQSPYSKSMGALTNKVVNRQAFAFDPATDQSYQALAKQYGQLGDRARQDTMADVAGNTGGLVSSYAVTAGQEAQNGYNQQLVGQIPALLDAAYSRYQGNFNMDNTALSQLQAQDDSAYGKFSDQRTYDRGVLESDRGYNYQKGRDAVGDSQWGQQFNYGKTRDQVADTQWGKEFGLSVSKAATAAAKKASSSKSSSKKKKSTGKIALPKSKSKSKDKTPFQSAIQADWEIRNKFAFDK